MTRTRRLGAFLFSAMVAACAGPGMVTDPLRPARAPRAEVLRNVVTVAQPVALEAHDGQVWLLSRRGALLSLTERGAAVRHLADEDVLGVHRSPDDRLWSISRDPKTDDLRLWERQGRSWSPAVEWMGLAAPPVALTSSGNRPVVIAPAAAWVLEGEDLRGIGLSANVATPGHHVLAAATRSGTAYVHEPIAGDAGYLNAIDLETGEVDAVECPLSLDLQVVGHRGAIRPCAGVTGMVADPARSGCVLVSFAHGGDGLLWRLCDDTAGRVTGAWDEVAFEDAPEHALAAFLEPRSETSRVVPSSESGAAEDGGAVPLLGLAPAADGVWVVTRDLLILWREGAASRFVLRTAPAPSATPTRELGSVTTVSERQRTLVAAELDAASKNEAESPPSAACYRAPRGATLCMKGGRYHFEAGGAVSEGVVVVRALGDGSYAADVGPERLRIHFATGRALLVRQIGSKRHAARLARLPAEEERSVLESAFAE